MINSRTNFWFDAVQSYNWISF